MNFLKVKSFKIISLTFRNSSVKKWTQQIKCRDLYSPKYNYLPSPITAYRFPTSLPALLEYRIHNMKTKQYISEENVRQGIVQHVAASNAGIEKEYCETVHYSAGFVQLSFSLKYHNQNKCSCATDVLPMFPGYWLHSLPIWTHFQQRLYLW